MNVLRSDYDDKYIITIQLLPWKCPPIAQLVERSTVVLKLTNQY